MTIEERIAALELMVGTKYIGKSSDELAASLTPENTIPGGRYPLFLSDYQIRVGIADISGKPGPVGPQGPQGLPGSSSSGGTSVDVVGQLAALNINVARNVLAVGIMPDPDSSAGLQVGGEAAAEVLGTSNTKGTDGQNPGEVHKGVVSVIGNDGGMRLIQYGHWGPNGLKRNTSNRDMTILALDSMGDLCISKDQAGSGTARTYGQHFYMTFNWITKMITLAAFQVGWKIRLRESSVYGGADLPPTT